MTDDQIRELAAKHAAYADSTLILRGDAVVAFARELLDYKPCTYPTCLDNEDERCTRLLLGECKGCASV